MDKSKVYCYKCNKELLLDKDENIFKYQCLCYKDTKYKYVLTWCDECQRFTGKRSFNSKCIACASLKWRKEDPEKSREVARKGALGLAKIIKNMSYEEKVAWTKRSCNSETANKSPASKSTNTGIKFCKNCKCETFHLNNMCTKCFPSSGVGRTYSLAFNFQQSFKTENNILYYLDKSLKDYIPWEDFKQKFIKKRLTKDINTFIEKLKGIKDFKDSDIQIFPTFRTQDSQDWSGSRCAFEKYLVEQNIKWFTYIKFYIDKNQCIRPLVVGKTGTLLVNRSGTDISFSEDINDGPARQFLAEECLSWDKTQILIIKAKSEKQALFFENRIANIFNLFES